MVLETSAARVNQPVYYYREYKNDIPEVKSEESHESAWVDQCQRVALVALPFVSLYKPCSFPLSLAMGGLRTFTCINQFLSSIKNGHSEEIPYAMLQTAIAVIALAGTIFAHPLGMLISTGHDLVIETVYLIENLKKGEHQKATENCLAIINNALYLALFLDGGLEIAIASLAMQILVGLYHSHAEFKKGNYLEGTGHLLMTMIRGNQLAGQAKMLQTKWLVEDLSRRIEESKPHNGMTESTLTKIHFKEQINQTDQRSIDKVANLGHSIKPSKIESNPRVIETLFQPQVELNSKPTPEEIAEILLRYQGAPDQAIFQAAGSGDLISVRKLLDYGVSENIKDQRGCNLVDAACGSGNLGLINFLIDEKRFVPSDNAFYNSIKNPNVFDHLIFKGFCVPKNILQFYLNSSISLGSPSQSPKLPEIDVTKFLIQRNADISFLSIDKTGSTEIARKLFYLLYNQNSLEISSRARELIELLLSYKMEVNFRGSLFRSPVASNGVYAAYNTPLLVAIASNDIKLVKQLLGAGADPNFSGISVFAGHTGKDAIGIYEYAYRGSLNCGGTSPLQVAIQRKHKEMAALLLNNSARD